MTHAFHLVQHLTVADGKIVTRHETNDDNDDGAPDGGETVEWTVGPQSSDTALRSPYDRSHIGCSGVHVYVYLDGKELT